MSGLLHQVNLDFVPFILVVEEKDEEEEDNGLA